MKIISIVLSVPLMITLTGWQALSLAQQDQQNRGDQPLYVALDWADRTGSPILVIAGRESCVACRALKKQIQSDPTTREMLGDCFKLYLDCDSEDYQKWVTMHRPNDTTLPQWYLVRADGKELINRSGNLSGEQLNRTLAHELKAAGKPTNERDYQEVQQLVEVLNKHLEKQQWIDAARVVSSSISVLRLAANSYAKPANQLREQLAQIQLLLTRELEQIETDLKALSELPVTHQQSIRIEIRQRMERLRGIPVIEKTLKQLVQAYDEQTR